MLISKYLMQSKHAKIHKQEFTPHRSQCIEILSRVSVHGLFGQETPKTIQLISQNM